MRHVICTMSSFCFVLMNLSSSLYDFVLDLSTVISTFLNLPTVTVGRKTTDLQMLF